MASGSVDVSELVPNGYFGVKEGKTQSAERILPLTPRAREVLPYIKPYIKDGA